MITMEIQDAATFVAMSKDLKPLGRAIVFEKNDSGASYHFITRQDKDIIRVKYPAVCAHSVIKPDGTVTHDHDRLVIHRQPEMMTRAIMRYVGVEGRESSRSKAMQEAYKNLMSSDRKTIFKWTSQNPMIKNLQVILRNRGIGKATVTIKYTNVHIEATTLMLEKAGYKVIKGHIY